MRRAEAPASAHPSGPTADAGKGEGEEDEEKDSMRLGLPNTPKNCIPRRGISVLEKLVKTCPVWLQLGLSQAEAARILQREVAGMFLVCRDSSLKRLVLCVHFPSPKDSSTEVLEYPIKEEKSVHLPFNPTCQLTSGVEVLARGMMLVDQIVLESGAFLMSNFQMKRAQPNLPFH